MSKRFSRVRFWCSVAVLAIAFQACGATPAAVSTPTASSYQVPAVSPSPSALLSLVKAAAAPSVTPSVSPTPTSAPVLVTATKGNVFIRRGPDLAFNPLSLLRDGQSARPLARDVLGGWVQIPFPGQPDKTGWISVQTHYIVVSGNVISLPEVEPTDWPVPASLLNCTNHEMLVDPGGVVLPSVGNFPENDLSVNPGRYVVRDADADAATTDACPTRRPGKAAAWACYSVILTVDVSEGSMIIIGTDGQKKNCPVPYESYTPRCAKRPGDRGVVACATPP